MALPPIGATSSLFEQLKKVREITGKTPGQLEDYEAKKLPPHLRYLFEYFQDFYNGDQFSYTELQSWQAFMGFSLEYWEAELIRQLCLERQAFDFKRQQEHLENLKRNKGK